MLEQQKKNLIISSVITLLPILLGLLLWNQLPGTFATHWGADGEADGWSSKAFAVFAPPLIMLAGHWFCILLTAADPGNKRQTRKAAGLVLWIMPMVSLFSSAVIYGTALGAELNMGSIVFAMLGLMFVLIGNYLPKVKQNYTIGIKVSWALHNEENWNATHRFGGKVWVIGGVLLLLMSLFPIDLTVGLMMPLILIMAFIPMLYSYLYYKKQCREGIVYDMTFKPMDKTTRIILKGTLIFVAVILVIAAFLLFTGDIEYTYEENSFTMDPSFWSSLTVDYDQVTSMELRNETVSGTRVWGLGSFRLLLGTFESEEFGSYTRYTYNDPESCIILTVGEKVLVISGEDAEDTLKIYNELSQRIP